MKTLKLRSIIHYALCFFIFISLMQSCGFVQETNLLPNNFQDPDAPYILSVTPPAGSKVDSSTFGQIDIVFSEEVLGAEVLGNYRLSGAGASGLSIDQVMVIDESSYRLALSGVPGDGSVMLTIENVSDALGNALSGSSVSYTGWWDVSWSNRRRLVFDNSGQPQNLDDFPVMVKLTSGRINYGVMQSGGEDIRFLDSDRSPLSHELEMWNESGESVLWVKVPRIDAASTSDHIWMYYGNDTASDVQDTQAVWDNNFMVVWHMHDQPLGGADDIGESSQNLVLPDTGVGTTQGMVSGNRTISSVGYGIRFNGSNQSIIPLSPTPGFFHNTISSKMVTLWLKPDDTSATQTLFEEGGSTNGFYLGIDPDGANPDKVRVVSQNSNSIVEVNSDAVDTVSHHYVVGAFDNGNLSLYVDDVFGNTVSTGYASIGSHSGEPGVGFSPDSDAAETSGGYFEGVIDELRISNVVRSADWIAAQYLSLNDSLISFGIEE
jgi:hypothetical protein